MFTNSVSSTPISLENFKQSDFLVSSMLCQNFSLLILSCTKISCSAWTNSFKPTDFYLYQYIFSKLSRVIDLGK